jgi:predicted Rossmann-fold nucleotide-binding protein
LKAKTALKAVFVGAATGAAEGAVTGAAEAGEKITGATAAPPAEQTEATKQPTKRAAKK